MRRGGRRSRGAAFSSGCNLQLQTAHSLVPPMQSPPTPSLPQGTITGVFLRPPGAAGSEIFERRAPAEGVPVALGLLGLEGSQEWHRLEKSAGKLTRTDAADRAVLMQVPPRARIAFNTAVTRALPPPASAKRTRCSCWSSRRSDSLLQSRRMTCYLGRSARTSGWSSAQEADGIWSRCV